MKRAVKQKPKNSVPWIRGASLIVLLIVIGVGASLLLKNEKRQICIVDQGDIVCVDDNLSNLQRHEFPGVNSGITAINAAPSNKFFIADTESELRDDPLDLYDRNMNYMGPLNLPVARYDMQKIQWTKDGSKAYILSDIGILYEFDPASKNLTQITNGRGDMSEREEFSDNKKGFVRDYYLVENGRLVLTVENIKPLALEADSITDGPYNETKVYVMNTDGSNIKQLGQQKAVAGLSVINKETVIYSITPLGYCQWGDECRQLYKADIPSGTEELVAGQDLEFRNFVYDRSTDTLFLTRGPGGSVAEVYYGKFSEFGKNVNKIKLSQASTDSTQGNLSLVPLSDSSIAVVSGYDGSGVIEKFDLKTGNRIASIDAPAIKFDGVEQLVRYWQP